MSRQGQVAHAQPQGHAHRQAPQGKGPEQVNDHPDALKQVQPQHGRRAQKAVIEHHFQQVHLDDLLLAAPAHAHQGGEGHSLPELGDDLVQGGGAAREHRRLQILFFRDLLSDGKGLPDGLQGTVLTHRHQHQQQCQHQHQHHRQPPEHPPFLLPQARPQPVAAHGRQGDGQRQKGGLCPDDEHGQQAHGGSYRLHPGPAGLFHILLLQPSRQHHRQHEHHHRSDVVARIEEAPAAPVAHAVGIGKEAHTQHIGHQHAHAQHQQGQGQHLVDGGPQAFPVPAVLLQHDGIRDEHHQAVAEPGDVLDVRGQAEGHAPQHLSAHRQNPGKADAREHEHRLPLLLQEDIGHHQHQHHHPDGEAGAQGGQALDIPAAEHAAVAAAQHIGPDAVDQVQGRADHQQQPEQLFKRLFCFYHDNAPFSGRWGRRE